jgi:hypothetical protein
MSMKANGFQPKAVERAILPAAGFRVGNGNPSAPGASVDAAWKGRGSQDWPPYYLLAGGMMPFMRAYSTIWP